MHGAAEDEKEIEGIRLADVPDLFRDRFGAGEQTRVRIDGRVQRCWRDYHIVEGGSRK